MKSGQKSELGGRERSEMKTAKPSEEADKVETTAEKKDHRG